MTQDSPPKRDAGRAPSVRDNEEQLADTPQIRALRMAVFVMGIVLIVGFLAVIGRIVYLASRTPAQAPAQAVAAGGASPGPAVAPGSAAVALKPEALLELPADANVRSLSLSGERLAVQYTSPRGDGIAVLDLVTGRVVSRVRITPEPR